MRRWEGRGAPKGEGEGDLALAPSGKELPLPLPLLLPLPSPQKLVVVVLPGSPLLLLSKARLSLFFSLSPLLPPSMVGNAPSPKPKPKPSLFGSTEARAVISFRKAVASPAAKAMGWVGGCEKVGMTGGVKSVN